ncbi:MAG: hypothetical protein ACOC97_03600 [Myxococcota bacterium]
MRSSLRLALALATAVGCGTVDPGDNFVTPEARVDEDFFYCRVQPEVISAQSCASGGAGEDGSCHADRSALRLSPEAETATPPDCVEGEPVTEVPEPYVQNLDRIQALAVGADPSSSGIYRRPLGLDSHPRVIFEQDSTEAMLLAEWLNMGGE